MVAPIDRDATFATRRTASARRRVVNLATNSLAGGPYPSVVHAIADAAPNLHNYPEPGSLRLREALAHYYRVDAGQVITGSGSVAVLQRLIQISCTSPGDSVMFGWPNFPAFSDLAEAAGAAQQRVPLTSESSVDLYAMLAEINLRTRAVIVCNPHNPSGTLLDAEALRYFLSHVPEDVLVILDEAYREFVEVADLPDGLALAHERWAAGHHNVVVVRTFSKAFGLGGLRVGYAIAPSSLATVSRAFVLPYEVNAAAQVAALAALGAAEEMAARCRVIAGERSRVQEALRVLGFAVPKSQANFVWLPLGLHAAGFARHALNYRIRVMAFPGDGVRVTIGTREDNDAFLAAANAWPAMTTSPTRSVVMPSRAS